MSNVSFFSFQNYCFSIDWKWAWVIWIPMTVKHLPNNKFIFESIHVDFRVFNPFLTNYLSATRTPVGWLIVRHTALFPYSTRKHLLVEGVCEARLSKDTFICFVLLTNNRFVFFGKWRVYLPAIKLNRSRSCDMRWRHKVCFLLFHFFLLGIPENGMTCMCYFDDYHEKMSRIF